MSAGGLSTVFRRRATAALLRPARRLISIAFVAGLLFVPVVVATGFLTERPAPDPAPADITVAMLRGTLEP